jgi:DNA-binding CsgD family transcriptional regulator
MRVLTLARRTSRDGPFGESSKPKAAKPSELVLSQAAGATADVGFLLADVNLKPLYANNTAVRILQYTRSSSAGQPAELQKRLRLILHAECLELEPSPTSFLSGRRRYVCRPFLLESRQDDARSPTVALLLERCPREELDPSAAGRGYHLTRREWEAVRYLMRGLTTKEVAEHMRVSPNTVKQFVRLAMGKMGVTTRSGIWLRLLHG